MRSLSVGEFLTRGHHTKTKSLVQFKSWFLCLDTTFLQEQGLQITAMLLLSFVWCGSRLGCICQHCHYWFSAWISVHESHYWPFFSPWLQWKPFLTITSFLWTNSATTELLSSAGDQGCQWEKSVFTLKHCHISGSRKASIIEYIWTHACYANKNKAATLAQRSNAVIEW